MTTKRGVRLLWLLLFPVAIFALLFLMASGAGEPQTVPSPTLPNAVNPQTPTLPALTPAPSPYPLSEDKPPRYNFLLLGGDYRSGRQGTRYGDKTDVMLLVSIYLSDPIDIRVIQFNRNFYHPVENFPDVWLFHVYGRENFPGVHYYFQQVFDVDLSGIAYIHMDHFETFVDEIGMIYVDGQLLDGQAALAYLRDNENNWGCNPWDCENRQMKVLLALAEKVKTRFGESPLKTANKLWKAYGYLFETDLSEFEQIHWLVEMGWLVATSKYEISGPYKMDNSPFFEYGDTPLEVRGWVQRDGYNVQEWIKQTLED